MSEQLPEPVADEPQKRRLEIQLEIVQALLARVSIYDIDPEAVLSRMRKEDPVAELVIRTQVERYFPGSDNMVLKSRVYQLLLYIDYILNLTEERSAGIDEMLKELDKLEFIDGDGGLPPLGE